MKFTFTSHRCDVDNTTGCQQQAEREKISRDKHKSLYRVGQIK